MDRQTLPWWQGALYGVAAATATSLLLAWGSTALRDGASMSRDHTQIRLGVLLLLATGGLVAGVAYQARLSPLIPGIPALWFVFVFRPFVIGPSSLSWYPGWVTEFAVTVDYTVGVILVGTMVIATVVAYVSHRRRRRSSGSSTEGLVAARS